VIHVEVVESIIKAFRSAGVDIQNNYQQEPVRGKLTEGYFVRVATGFEREFKWWNEIGILYPKDDEPVTPERWNEIVLEAHEMQPFKYHTGHENAFGRTVFVIIPKNKGYLTPRYIKKGSYKELYVPVIEKTGELNVNVTVNLYLANMFFKRVRGLEAELTSKQRSRWSLWQRYRLLLRGKLRSLTSNLVSLYNYYTEFSRTLREKNSVELAKTLHVLTELFFTFLREADRYARKLFKSNFVKKVVETAKKVVGITEVPDLLMEAYRYAIEVREKSIRLEAEKLLRRISSAEIQRG